MKTQNPFFARLRVWSLAILACIGCAAAFADELDRRVQFDIPAQELLSALYQFSAQAKVQVVAKAVEVSGAKTQGLSGLFPVNRGLDELLRGTQFTFEATDANTIAITSKTERTEHSAAAANIVLAQTTEAPENDAASRSEPSGEALEEIVVTGTHIRGTQNNTAAMTVLDKAYIDSTGISTITRLIESLPQNFALASQAGSSIPGVSDAGGTQGTSINLRGIGEGTTLTLLNGRRMAAGFNGSAVDISAIPLSAIERVEVMTDGASALYGSDAVGGVVNFILRDRFEGAETRLQSGWADGGVNEYRASQTLGHVWSSGNALASLGYYKRDLLPASKRDFVPSTSILGSLYPQEESRSAMFSGRQSLTDTLQAFADALYTERDARNEAGSFTTHDRNHSANPQLTATAGLDVKLPGQWQLEASGSYARNKIFNVFESDSLGGTALVYNSVFDIEAAQIKADGPIMSLPGGEVRAALGADWRSEAFRYRQAFGSLFVLTSADLDQIVRSAFGEVRIPLVGEDNGFRGVERFELSLAGRFDDYSNFGSSFDPRFGFMWEPVGGLRLRGSYGTSYRAPTLDDYNLSRNNTQLFTGLDAGAPGGTSFQMQVRGSDVASLGPEESTSYSFGLEFSPAATPHLQMALNYFDIDYEGRIGTPQAPEVVLANPASYSPVTIRNPSVAQIDEAIAAGHLGQGFFVCNPGGGCGFDLPFDPAAVAVIVDLRRRNLSLTKTNGFDLSAQYAFDAASGKAQLGISATHILELTQQVTSVAQPLDTADTFHNPVDWRIRGAFGWQRQGWSSNLFVNYSDSYTDNRTATPTPIDSYTTVDLRLGYDFGERFTSGPLSGLSLSMNAQNLFDEDPPRTAIVNTTFFDAGYDPTNASPIGRLVAIELAKTW